MSAFLFTDLESSTRLWEEQPQEMAAALARHDTILREAVATAGGTVVKSTGDGMLASFDTATDAVTAGIGAQLALLGEPWPGEPLRVRMGVHTGDGEERDGDVYGRDVNRAARIMAAGHGGQILVSAAVAARAALPDGAALRDLGLHRLRDLTHPERLHQILHPAMPSEFPPPSTLDAVPNNLPVQLSEFLGREQELATISAMVVAPATRLLTLTGPGGAGKTRLALQAAADVLDEFRDGAFFVDLSAVREPDAAFESIVLALDLPTASAGAPLRILEARLRDRQGLIVLDNLEQVTAIATGLAELLARCPELKVLATSRESLRIRGEQVFPVPPLSVPHPESDLDAIADSEAVRLFVDRARGIRADFELTEANARAIAEICLRLDGLPLAIELAAARLNVFSPIDLAERLRGRLDVLVSSHRDLPNRQRTLWGAIGWSYELLDPAECRLFETMSVFAPTELAELEAVSAVLSGGGPVIDVLASLVDKNLVRSSVVDGSQRFAMLHTIREYAAERLAASGGEDDVRRAHATVFADRLVAAHGSGAFPPRGVDPENLRIAWSYWVGDTDLERVLGMHDPMWSFEERRGSNLAAIALDDDVLALLSRAGGDHTGRALYVRARRARAMLAVHGYTAEVDQAFREVVALAADAEAGDRLAVLVPIAGYLMTASDFASTVSIGREILDDAERTHDAHGIVDGHYTMGVGLAFGGDTAAGLELIDRAAELWDSAPRATDRPRGGAVIGVTARVAGGLIRWSLGDLGRAVELVDGAFALAHTLGHPMSLAHATWHHGLLALERQRYEEAFERARELAAIAERADFPVWRTLAVVLEGAATAGRGDAETGLRMTELGVGLYQGLISPPVFWPDLLRLRAGVSVLAGDGAGALSLIDEAISLFGSVESAPPEHLVVRGDAILASPERTLEEALAAYDAAVHRAKEAGARLVELVAATRVVRVRRRLGLDDDRAEALRDVYGSFGDGTGERALLEAAEILGHHPIPTT